MEESIVPPLGTSCFEQLPSPIAGLHSRTLLGRGQSGSGSLCFLPCPFFYTTFPMNLKNWKQRKVYAKFKIRGYLHGVHPYSAVESSGISILASVCYFLHTFVPQSFCKFKVKNNCNLSILYRWVRDPCFSRQMVVLGSQAIRSPPHGSVCNAVPSWFSFKHTGGCSSSFFILRNPQEYQESTVLIPGNPECDNEGYCPMPSTY
jgi:hypothetical protein